MKYAVKNYRYNAETLHKRTKTNGFLMSCGDNAMHRRIPAAPQWGLTLNCNIKNHRVCYDPGKDRLIFFSHCSNSTVCLFLIRAVGEFSAQNENSRENSHHHRTAKFSISRNYAWPDVSIWVASLGFSISLFLKRIGCFIIFLLDKEDSVLFWLLLFLLSTENKLNSKSNNNISHYP